MLSMNMRASLEIFRIFTLKNYSFFQHFVGTSLLQMFLRYKWLDCRLHVPTNLRMYWLNSEKHYAPSNMLPPIMLLFVPFFCLYNNVFFSVGKFGGLAPQYPLAGYSTAGSP